MNTRCVRSWSLTAGRTCKSSVMDDLVEAVGLKEGQTSKVVVNSQNGRLRATDDDDDYD